VFNVHNSHLWERVNPHGNHKRVYQVRSSDNVWAGVVGDIVVDLSLLSDRLAAQHRDFLETVLQGLLEGVPLAVRQSLFQPDGAPAHYEEDVRQWLNATYPKELDWTSMADCMVSSFAGSNSNGVFCSGDIRRSTFI
jgi:hypothetical protein